MASVDYVKFFPADYLADTIHLNLDEHGAYFKLILHYYQSGTAINSKIIPRILGVNPKKSKRLMEIVEEFFEKRGDFLYHDRIERELEFLRTKAEKARNSANIRWNKQAGKKDANALQSECHPECHEDKDKDKDEDKDITLSSPEESDDSHEEVSHETKKPVICPHKKIIALYHEHCPDLPKIRSWEGSRMTNLAARWRSHNNIEWWEWLFKTIHTMDFYNGRESTNRESPWRADLAWIAKAANFQKLIDKTYDLTEG